MPPARPRRILFVAKGKALSQRLLSRLRNEAEVVCVSTAADGYLAARTQQFDLFLFTDRLQLGSGIELCRQVRDFDARTPAIILLNGTRRRRAEDALETHAQLIVAPPFDPDLLLEDIRRLLASAGRGEEGREGQAA
jgi:DNA-binding response OmpR family regulator